MKGCHFDTIEVTEAESQGVLNILTEHDFKDALKNGRSTGYGACSYKGTSLRLLVASRPKDSFYWMEDSVPKIWIALCKLSETDVMHGILCSAWTDRELVCFVKGKFVNIMLRLQCVHLTNTKRIHMRNHHPLVRVKVTQGS
jgi:hypothetical protein